jgi:hypothetical protein
MADELNVNATVTGVPTIDVAAASTGKLAGETSALNNVLYGASAAQEKLTLLTAKLAIEQAKIQQLTIQYNIALLGEARAADAAAASQERLAAATQKTVGSTMAAGTALRVMEGAMPLRAAASFLGSIQGISTAMQFMFPLFGAFALVEVLDKIIGQVEKWANAHDPVLEAQRTSIGLLKEEGKEYDQLAKKAQEYSDRKFGDKFGQAALDRLQASRFGRTASQEDQDQIDKLQAIQAALGRIAKTPANAGDIGFATPAARGSIASMISPDDSHLAGRIKQALGLNPTENTGLEGLLGKTGQWASPSEAAAANEMSVGVGEAIAAAKMRQKSDLDDKDAKGADAAKKDAAEDEKNFRTRWEGIVKHANQVQEWQGILDRASNKVTTGDERYGSRLMKGADTLLNSGHPLVPVQDMDAIQAFENSNTERSVATSMMPRRRDQTDDFLSWVGRGQDAAAEQLRLTRRDDEQADSKSTGLFGARATSAGMSRQDQANGLYNLRTSNAEQSYEHIVQLSAQLADGEKTRLEAVEQLKQKLFDADMDRQKALLEVASQQKQQAENLAGGLFDAIHSHSTNQWTRAFGVGQEKALFENLASPLIGNVSHMLGGAIGGQTDANGNPTAIGNILHGTILSSSNADPAKATATNTADTVKQLILMRGDMKSATTGNVSGADPNSVTSPVGINDLPITGGPALGMMLGVGGGTSTSSAALSSLGQFAKAMSAGPVSAFSALFQNTPPGTVGYGPDGTPHDQYGNPITQTGGTIAGQAATLGAAFATGTLAAVQSFSKGGAGGALGGASALLGMAAMIPSPATPFLAAGAAAAGVAASLFSVGPAQRAQQFTNDIAKNQYLAPTALNVTQGMSGTYQSFDARGNIQTSTMRALPTVAEPYITTRELNGSQSWYDAPGLVTQPYQGGAKGTGANPVGNGPGSSGGAGTTVIIQGGINAIDPSSFHELLQRPAYSHAVGESLATHLQSHEGRASNAIRYVAGA